MVKVAEPTWQELRNCAKRQKLLDDLNKVYNRNLAIIHQAIEEIKKEETKLTLTYEKEYIKIQND